MKGKGKRSVELCISAGGGSISTRHVLASHGGLAPLTVQNLTVPRFTTGVLDPAAGRGALNYHADYGSLGHVDEDDNSGVMRVREAIEPWKQWKIDPALKVGSFSAFGDFLVALAAPAEDFPPEVVFRPHKLVCMRVLRDEENGISEVMWECDVQDEWLDTEDEYYQFPSISMFKLTRSVPPLAHPTTAR